MGNKPKTQPQNDRRAKVEALKRQQKAAERRKTMTIVAAAVVVAGALIAVPTIKIISDREKANIAISDIGVGAAGANCGEVKVDKTTGSGDHVDHRVEYATIPPSSGEHRPVPAAITARGFYTPDDVPDLEELVHNLEHGYTILWYLPTIAQVSLDEIKQLAERLRDDNTYRKFIAVPWDTARGNFPKGMPVALSHWGATEGYRQYCQIVSGEAVESFMKKYPASNSPEPNAP